ncbi:hypothetical protein [Paenarthrobacter sp. YJN-5]|uniref:hypothetical protein n=1 Tax=Paenarthrobacter sp. YJN-5 TaxID=2735316 RepID=UPI001877A6F0|nr:hypothetical protein [Paenarthrobacter sp. YJN-5]QOT19369.1 hypothetical protein HMI59_22200 [Paenarthrobacter sp. YJN-5]
MTVVDNYGEFLQRLDTAAASLKKRHDKLSAALAVVSIAADQNQFGLDQWTKRHARLEGLLGNKNQAPAPALKDLYGVSGNMVSVFRARSENVEARRAAVQKRVNEICRSLNSLELSKQKLTSSRRFAEERENLSKAVLGLAGTAEGFAAPTPDGGLRDDLKTAREAVLLAEALLELKENHK